MTIRLAIFDCDGTLVDSQHNICAAMERAFAEVGAAPPTRDAIRGIVGLSILPAVQALAPGADDAFHRDVARAYKAAFFAMRADGTLEEEPLFDGIVDVLDRLTAAGWALGVATGKSDRGLSIILAHHGLTDRFVTLQTADRHPSKPHPSMIEQAMADADALPKHTAMVGDTSFDMAMARAAGVRAVGVTWGYHPVTLLRDSGADVVAMRCADLVECLA